MERLPTQLYPTLAVRYLSRFNLLPPALKSLTSGGTDYVVDGGPKLLELKMPGTGAAAGDSTLQKQEFNAARQALIQIYPWGSTRIDYSLHGNDLQMDVTVKNGGRRALSKVVIGLMTMKFPAVPEGSDWKGRFTASVDRTDDLPVVMADWHDRHIAMCSDEIEHFTHFGWKPNGDTNWDAFVSFGEIKPVMGGETRTTRVSFRIGVDQPGLTPPYNPWIDADDVCKKYAAKFPSELNWPDRRPIGSAFLATSVAGYKTNPRGWFLDPNLDTSTAEGRDKFKATLMTYADAVVAHCKTLNAQGVIVWDIEGQEMPHATSYLADPRMLSKVAPEMDAVADEFMKKFTDAGLRTGITLRPTRVAPNDHGAGWMQADVSDQTAEIEKKVQYAQKRWGCTLYYCDSNVDFVKDAKGKVLNDLAMPAADFKKVAEMHKDCLLMPEHKTSQYWAYTRSVYGVSPRP